MTTLLFYQVYYFPTIFIFIINFPISDTCLQSNIIAWMPISSTLKKLFIFPLNQDADCHFIMHTHQRSLVCNFLGSLCPVNNTITVKIVYLCLLLVRSEQTWKILSVHQSLSISWRMLVALARLSKLRTVRIVAKELLLNVDSFQIKWQKC